MKTNVLLLALASLFLASCAMVGPTGGAVYHDIKYGQFATENTAATKTGTACQSSVLGLVAQGDASIEAAKKDGGITKVSSIDSSSTNVVFGIYNKYCTIVKGN